MADLDRVAPELLAEARTGNRAAYASLFEVYRRRIGEVAALLVQEESAAQGVVEETFARGLESIPRYSGGASPELWFLGIAINVRRQQIGGGGRGTDAARPEKPPVVQDDSVRELRHAMGFLSEAQREVLALGYRGNLSFDDIGAVLGMHTLTARTLLDRAKAILEEKRRGDPAPDKIAGVGNPDGVVYQRRVAL